MTDGEGLDAGKGGRRREEGEGFGGFGTIYGGDGPVGFDVADAPEHPHIHPTIGLDMRGAGQPGRLRPI